MKKQKIINLNAINLIDTEALYMTKKQIMEELDISRIITDKYITEFKEEVLRGDIFPSGAYIEINPKARWIHRKSFYYFLENYNALKDKNARECVQAFDARKEDTTRLYSY